MKLWKQPLVWVAFVALLFVIGVADSVRERERRYGASRLSEMFLNGVNQKDVGSLLYFARGNHAGVGAIARIEVSPAVAAKILTGAQSWGLYSPTNAEEGMPIMRAVFGGPAPEWYQLDEDHPIATYRRDTYGEIIFYFYDPAAGTMYVHYSHI